MWIAKILWKLCDGSLPVLLDPAETRRRMRRMLQNVDGGHGALRGNIRHTVLHYTPLHVSAVSFINNGKIIFEEIPEAVNQVYHWHELFASPDPGPACCHVWGWDRWIFAYKTLSGLAPKKLFLVTPLTAKSVSKKCHWQNFPTWDAKFGRGASTTNSFSTFGSHFAK